MERSAKIKLFLAASLASLSLSCQRISPIQGPLPTPSAPKPDDTHPPRGTKLATLTIRQPVDPS